MNNINDNNGMKKKNYKPNKFHTKRPRMTANFSQIPFISQ